MSKEISNRIKELRVNKGYTQKEFASLIGVAQTTIANYEKGIRIPDTGRLDKIASLFEVTVDYLLGRDEAKTYSINNEKGIDFALMSTYETYKAFIGYLLNGERENARKLITDIYEAGIGLRIIYFDILAEALKEVGVLWESGSIDVWKEHFISEAILDIMREIKIREKKITSKSYSMLALTVGSELHNIGLKMITDILEVEGWEVTYLGSNLPVQSLIIAIEIEKPDVVAISITMPYHIESAKYSIAAIRNYFGKKAPKIIVGGAAFSNCKNICEETGADYYGMSVEDIKNVMKKR